VLLRISSGHLTRPAPNNYVALVSDISTLPSADTLRWTPEGSRTTLRPAGAHSRARRPDAARSRSRQHRPVDRDAAGSTSDPSDVSPLNSPVVATLSFAGPKRRRRDCCPRKDD